MKPDISEFSYGYALTDELIHWHGSTLTAAPLFPSLYQEGRPGGGYDLMLKRPGIPLFLQFKLSDCMVRSSAKQAREGYFTVPYYRMFIRPACYSKQHEMLLDLENDRNEVYYSAPCFYLPEELNEAYLNHQVKDRSLWLRPSTIGPVQDDKHCVAFKSPALHYLCSEPKKLDAAGDFSEFSRTIQNAFRQKSENALAENNLIKIGDLLQMITEKGRDISPDAKQLIDIELKKRHPIERISFYVQVFMDCRLFLVMEKETDVG